MGSIVSNEGVSPEAVSHEAVAAQVDRVANSLTFRNAEVLRRLLRFLGERALAGEADQLKEYTIGIDALGKSGSYDPRQDSVVRIQVGRLRQKLADYYKDEGKHDLILLDLPKGRFKLGWTRKQADDRPLPALVPNLADAAIKKEPPAAFRLKYWIACVALLAVWASLSTTYWLQNRRDAIALQKVSTPELRQLWQPFLDSRKPLLIVVSSPLFVGFPGHGFFRDQSVNTWEDAIASPRIRAIQKALGNPPVVERYWYSGAGEMTACFNLGTVLNFTGLQVTTVRSSQVSWQQIVDNNAIFLGAPRIFGDYLQKIPTDLYFVMREDGVHELNPQRDTPVLYADDYPSIGNAKSSAKLPAACLPADSSCEDDGMVYALVSRMPGPLGTGFVQTFHSNHSPGTLGAVQSFTDRDLATELLTHLRKPDGSLPTYFQIILKVRYHDGVPSNVDYVTHRELHRSARPSGE